MTVERVKPVFILGVGAQKAGTSWLYRQLNRNPAVNMGFTKEYHIWDYIHIRDPKWLSAPAEKGELESQAMKRLMRTQNGLYEAYFKGLVNENIRFTGDITPAYAALDENHFVAIKERLERVGFCIKVVFLMRDPAERNWSALRMVHRDGAKLESISPQEDLLIIFDNFYKRPQMTIRTNYNKTVKVLRNVFDEEDIFFGIYERLFSDNNISSFSGFLGLDLNEVDFNEKVNSYDSIRLPLKHYNKCKEYYAEVYEYCSQHFPPTAHLWKRDT